MQVNILTSETDDPDQAFPTILLLPLDHHEPTGHLTPKLSCGSFSPGLIAFGRIDTSKSYSVIEFLAFNYEGIPIHDPLYLTR